MALRADTQQFKIWLLGIVLAILLFLSDSLIGLGLLRRVLSSFYAPAIPTQLLFSQLVIGPKITLEKTQQSTQKIQFLESQNAQLRAQTAQAEFLKRENEQLRIQLEKSSTSSAVSSLSSVVARVIYSFSETGIDVGTQQGVTQGDLVFWQDRLVGQVGKTDQNFSQVQFIDRGEVEIVAENQAGVVGLLRLNHGKVILDQIAIDEEIAVGDLIYSTGSVSQHIPVGLFIGEVKEIQSNPSSTVKIAVLDTGIPSQELSVVSIELERRDKTKQ